MSTRIATHVVSGMGALLTAYGASYGVRLNNGVLVAGVAVITVAAVSEYRVSRSVMSPVLALMIIAGFFALIGVPTLGLPNCPPPQGTVGCVASSAREITVVSLVVFAISVTTMVGFLVNGRLVHRRR